MSNFGISSLWSNAVASSSTQQQNAQALATDSDLSQFVRQLAASSGGLNAAQMSAPPSSIFGSTERLIQKLNLAGYGLQGSKVPPIVPPRNQSNFASNQTVFSEPDLRSSIQRVLAAANMLDQATKQTAAPPPTYSLPIDMDCSPGLQSQHAITMISSSDSKPSASRTFLGRVTLLLNNFGFVNDQVFFDKSVVVGPQPKVGDRVMVEATYMPHAAMKWTATSVQIIADTTSASLAEKHQPLAVAEVATLSKTPKRELSSDFSAGESSKSQAEPSPKINDKVRELYDLYARGEVTDKGFARLLKTLMDDEGQGSSAPEPQPEDLPKVAKQSLSGDSFRVGQRGDSAERATLNRSFESEQRLRQILSETERLKEQFGQCSSATLPVGQAKGKSATRDYASKQSKSKATPSKKQGEPSRANRAAAGLELPERSRTPPDKWTDDFSLSRSAEASKQLRSSPFSPRHIPATSLKPTSRSRSPRPILNYNATDATKAPALAFDGKFILSHNFPEKTHLDRWLYEEIRQISEAEVCRHREKIQRNDSISKAAFEAAHRDVENVVEKCIASSRGFSADLLDAANLRTSALKTFATTWNNYVKKTFNERHQSGIRDSYSTAQRLQTARDDVEVGRKRILPEKTATKSSPSLRSSTAGDEEYADGANRLDSRLCDRIKRIVNAELELHAGLLTRRGLLIPEEAFFKAKQQTWEAVEEDVSRRCLSYSDGLDVHTRAVEVLTEAWAHRIEVLKRRKPADADSTSQRPKEQRESRDERKPAASDQTVPNIAKLDPELYETIKVIVRDELIKHRDYIDRGEQIPMEVLESAKHKVLSATDRFVADSPRSVRDATYEEAIRGKAVAVFIITWKRYLNNPLQLEARRSFVEPRHQTRPRFRRSKSRDRSPVEASSSRKRKRSHSPVKSDAKRSSGKSATKSPAKPKAKAASSPTIPASIQIDPGLFATIKGIVTTELGKHRAVIARNELPPEALQSAKQQVLAAIQAFVADLAEGAEGPEAATVRGRALAVFLLTWKHYLAEHKQSSQDKRSRQSSASTKGSPKKFPDSSAIARSEVQLDASLSRVLDDIVKAQIDEHYDCIQRGEPLPNAAFQNAKEQTLATIQRFVEENGSLSDDAGSSTVRGKALAYMILQWKKRLESLGYSTNQQQAQKRKGDALSKEKRSEASSSKATSDAIIKKLDPVLFESIKQLVKAELNKHRQLIQKKLPVPDAAYESAKQETLNAIQKFFIDCVSSDDRSMPDPPTVQAKALEVLKMLWNNDIATLQKQTATTSGRFRIPRVSSSSSATRNVGRSRPY